MKHGARNRTSIYAGAGMALVVMIALAAALIANVAGGTAPRQERANAQDVPTLKKGACHGDGTATSLGTASAAATYQVFTPNDPLASASSASVYSCPGGGIEMDFASGLLVAEKANGIADPASAWSAVAEQDSFDTSVTTVLGQPALAIDPAKSPYPIDGSVTIVYKGTWILVQGNGDLSIADLERIAGSMVQPSTSGS